MGTHKRTSWGPAASWYSAYLETTPDSYQRQVILPNLLRLAGPRPGLRILDLACGQGFFSREFAKAGASVTGADISEELIEEARRLSPSDIVFHATPAHELSFATDGSFDAVTVVLAIQNIENMDEVFRETARVLIPGGKLYLVMMHPAFRIPLYTSWGWEEGDRAQYRRVDRYLSSAQMELAVHPGEKNSPVTVSYHRSLQDFSKALATAGFAISGIEEWVSHRASAKGPRQRAEDLARKEIPLFMMLEARRS